MRRFGFLHGVHPPTRKELTETLPIRRMPFPQEVVLPVRQHAGNSAKVVVRKGDRVERGDVVAVADGFISAPVHASAAGTVTAIEEWPHPDGGTALAVRIAVAPFSAQVPRPRMVPDWHTLSPAQVVKAVQDAGVVGLGGAALHAVALPHYDLGGIAGMLPHGQHHLVRERQAPDRQRLGQLLPRGRVDTVEESEAAHHGLAPVN